MGTSRSAQQLAEKLYKAGNAMPAAAREGVFQASLTSKEIMIEGVAQSGITPATRIPRSRNGRWSVGFNLPPGATSAFIRYRGPLHWIEGGTDAHTIGGPAGRRRGKRLKLPDGSIRTSVTHPGAPARPFWDGVKRRLIAAVPKAMQQAVRHKLIDTFH